MGVPDRGGLLPQIPVFFCICLVVASFYAGHWTQQLHSLEQDNTAAAAPQIDADRHLARRRALREGSQSKTAHAENVEAGPGRVMPPTDPLETADLERFMLDGSGLTKVRPAVQPAPSGDNFLRAIPFQIISWAPRLVVYPAFIDPARCKDIIDIANQSMYKSGLAFRPGEKVDGAQQVRTSSGTYLSSFEEGPGNSLSWLEERMAAASLLPSVNGEAFNVLRYENGQHYDSHMDSFDPKEYGPTDNQRMATFLVYLSDPQEGGETIFKREGAGNASRVIQNWRTCDDGIGLMYKPRQGDAVMFHSLHTNGEIDQQALHGGCAVRAGEKWVATKWVRQLSLTDGGRAAELDNAAHGQGGFVFAQE
eukprot:CAMPEP_0119108132 /NCGR_PEP_ID=MMETSP1180-20130426/13484_1 /TAXON_ID=3052 ORGANISM="Chlamydomonas cf sp, Strain CCMP681" /NCGR_SAMPLE_ID=MMETSP1180 /ASSEMBLY_ACC=CAM_ASM_000741 /LENGTH=364 /DNA_ID=CAMNT_0007093715 /DNA_START=1 /DNA_END=1095 /DNA_ORIENTATION=+